MSLAEGILKANVSTRSKLAPSNYPFRATIQRINTTGTTQSASGAPLSPTSTISGMTGVPLSFRPAGGNEIPENVQISSSTAYMLEMPMYLTNGTQVVIDATSQVITDAIAGAHPSYTFDIAWVGIKAGGVVVALGSLQNQ